MPLCGAVTKLTRPASDVDGCTLWTPAIVPTVSDRRRERKEGGDRLRAKKIAKKLDRGRLAAMYADAAIVVSQR